VRLVTALGPSDASVSPDLHPLPIRRCEGITETSVECGEHSTVRGSSIHQLKIRDLSASHENAKVHDGHRKGLVVFEPPPPGTPRSAFSCPSASCPVTFLPTTASVSNRRTRPASATGLVRQPISFPNCARGGMMDVLVPAQSEQDVDIEQRGP
jgi:hypothetical protein